MKVITPLTAIPETDVCRYHGDPIQGHPEIPRNITALMVQRSELKISEMISLIMVENNSKW